MNFLVLCDEVIDILDLDIAQTYKEIFDILKNGDIISKEDFDKCRKLVYLRNKLSHEYDKISLDELYELIEQINFIEILSKKLIKKIENK